MKILTQSRLRRQKGVSTVEYGLLTGLIAAGLITSVHVFSSEVNGNTDYVSQALSERVAERAAFETRVNSTLSGYNALVLAGDFLKSVPVTIPTNKLHSLSNVRVVSVQAPINGVASLEGREVLFQPDLDAEAVAFDFTLEDSNGNRVTKTYSMTAQYAQDCKQIQQANADAISGEYWIDLDLDGSLAPAKVQCDMDYKDGGWTKIIYGESTDLDYIAKFQPTSQIIDSFQTGTYGVSWGNTQFQSDFTQPTETGLKFPISFTELHVEFSGSYNEPSDSKGLLRLTNDAGDALLEFVDDNFSDSDGHNLYLNNMVVFQNRPTNLYNHRHEISASGTGLQIELFAGPPSLSYSQRWINQLWFR